MVGAESSHGRASKQKVGFGWSRNVRGVTEGWLVDGIPCIERHG